MRLLLIQKQILAIHTFSIIEKEKGTLDITEFKYKFSVDWSDSECFNNKNEYEIALINDNSEFNLKFSIFPDKTMKNSDGHILLEKIESEKSFYNNFKYGFLHHFDSCGKIKLDTNIVINNASFFDYDGNCLKRIKLINKLITEFNFSIKKPTYRNTTDYFYFIDKQ